MKNMAKTVETREKKKIEKMQKYFDFLRDADEIKQALKKAQEEFFKWLDEKDADILLIGDQYKITKVSGAKTGDSFDFKKFLEENEAFLKKNPEFAKLIKKYIKPGVTKKSYLVIS